LIDLNLLSNVSTRVVQ